MLIDRLCLTLDTKNGRIRIFADNVLVIPLEVDQPVEVSDFQSAAIVGYNVDQRDEWKLWPSDPLLRNGGGEVTGRTGVAPCR